MLEWIGDSLGWNRDIDRMECGQTGYHLAWSTLYRAGLSSRQHRTTPSTRNWPGGGGGGGGSNNVQYVVLL